MRGAGPIAAVAVLLGGCWASATPEPGDCPVPGAHALCSGVATLADASCLAVEVDSIPPQPDRERAPVLSVAWRGAEATSSRDVGLEFDRWIYVDSDDPGVAGVAATWWGAVSRDPVGEAVPSRRPAEPDRYRVGISWAVESDEIVDAWVDVAQGDAPSLRVDLLGCAF